MDGPRSAEEFAAVLETLGSADLRVVGQLTDASNVALLVDLVGGAPEGMRAVYKPVRGERPLWDFPEGTLAGREVAAFLVARAGGWGVVPPTVLRDGPLGEGSVQLWIGDPLATAPAGRGTTAVVDLVDVGATPPGWLRVVEGELPDGRPVCVVHEDRDDVRDAAVLDAVINNADRKGSHLERDTHGVLWGYDHGVTFNAAPKLRTVLWGWAGAALRERDLDRLTRLDEQLADAGGDLARRLERLLPGPDLAALRARVRALLLSGVHPLPVPGRPAIPWPAL